MGVLKSLYSGLLFSVLVVLLCCGAGCEEYSYEGGPLRDSTIDRDTVLMPPDTTVVTDTALLVAPCAFCKHATSLSLDQWNFRYDTFFLCGTVSNAVMNPDKNAFTFFGPSACTPGTGLIITAFFSPETFDGDRAGITSTRVTLQYYDNNAPQDIFRSGLGTRFSITINQFEQQSGIAIGRFSGTALTARGAVVAINAGNFKIHFN